jgi:hypothetical protein
VLSVCTGQAASACAVPRSSDIVITTIITVRAAGPLLSAVDHYGAAYLSIEIAALIFIDVLTPAAAGLTQL